ncbi:hypothetical protein BDW68DRAFT_172210 [Aspergillus falconensis]
MHAAMMHVVWLNTCQSRPIAVVAISDCAMAGSKSVSQTSLKAMQWQAAGPAAIAVTVTIALLHGFLIASSNPYCG